MEVRQLKRLKVTPNTPISTALYGTGNSAQCTRILWPELPNLDFYLIFTFFFFCSLIFNLPDIEK